MSLLNFFSGIGGGILPTFGSIYSKSSFASAADFDNTGVTTSIVSNAIRISGGTGNYSKYLSLNTYPFTLLNKWNFTIRFKPVDNTSTSWGISFGVRSINSWASSQKWSWNFGINLTNVVGNTGKFAYNNSVDAVNFTNKLISSAIPWVVGDTIELKATRNLNVVTVVGYNVTTPSTPISISMTVPVDGSDVTNGQVNTGKFTIWANGGTQDITYINIDSDVTYRPYALVIGDSKVNAAPTVIADSYCYLLDNALPGLVTGESGPGDRTVELVNLTNELIRINPQKVLVCMGRNDIASGVSAGTWQANYAAFVTALINAGIDVYHLLPIAEALNQSALKTWIQANYSAAKIIEVTSTVSLADGVHPNTAGHAAIFNDIVASGKI